MYNNYEEKNKLFIRLPAIDNKKVAKYKKPINWKRKFSGFSQYTYYTLNKFLLLSIFKLREHDINYLTFETFYSS